MRRTWVLALIAAFALIVAACGGDNEPAAPAATAAPTTVAPADNADDMADDMDDADDMTDDDMADDMADDMGDDDMTDDMGDDMGTVTFTIRIENISDTGGDQVIVPTPIAPVAAVVHKDANPIFAAGTSTRADGLEALAEDGGPDGLVASIGAVAQPVPVGADEPRPALPGEAYEFVIETTPGHRLSLATMFVQSNDWFFALDGIELFDGDVPLEGDISSLVTLWDAGTEVDQTLGEGPDQAPRQAGPNTGAADPDDTVRLVGTGEGYVKVTITVG